MNIAYPTFFMDVSHQKLLVYNQKKERVPSCLLEWMMSDYRSTPVDSDYSGGKMDY